MEPKTARTVVLALLVASSAVAPAAWAGADRLEVDVQGGAPVFDLDELDPGGMQHGVIQVTNRGAMPASLAAAATDVVRVGAVRAVELSIARVGVDGELEHVWRGRVGALRDIEVVAALAPGETVELRVSAHLPASAPEDPPQDGGLAFDLRFELAGDVVTVAGAELDGDETTDIAGMEVPASPDQLVAWGVGGVAVLLVGTVLLLGADAWRRNDARTRR